jgi:glycine/D-amino acid oxidase-like deaminating enzyme
MSQTLINELRNATSNANGGQQTGPSASHRNLVRLCERAVERIEELEAENARLRDGLEEIATEFDPESGIGHDIRTALDRGNS